MGRKKRHIQFLSVLGGGGANLGPAISLMVTCHYFTLCTSQKAFLKDFQMQKVCLSLLVDTRDLSAFLWHADRFFSHLVFVFCHVASFPVCESLIKGR